MSLDGSNLPPEQMTAHSGATMIPLSHVAYATAEDGVAPITFPMEHPAIVDPGNHRSPWSGLWIDGRVKEIRIRGDGWLDGPVTIGAGWSVRWARVEGE